MHISNALFVKCWLIDMQVLDVGSADFSLTRLYPRLELTVDMELKTMVDLELAPTGVIIIKMKKVYISAVQLVVM